MRVRRWSTSWDGPLTFQRLQEVKAKARKGWVLHATPESAYAGLQDQHTVGNVFVIDEHYLVAVAHGSPWYNQDIVILEEVMVLALVPGGNFRSVTDFLDMEAHRRGASFIASGTALATSDRALSRLYARAGYTPDGTMLTKLV